MCRYPAAGGLPVSSWYKALLWLSILGIFELRYFDARLTTWPEALRYCGRGFEITEVDLDSRR